ncbi:YceD family protein [Luteithermobacter gelatinilyticus]|uniref:YceD family protein n=1 Tax=Luteithermobacter gelatinilyticus TaxID=2582913 RepID=UPI0011065003|nr:DUF177 domain-containing protein [Luteithermobacter gelatinilyticus]
MTSHTPVSELSRPVDITTLPKSGREFVIEGSPEECAALARRFSVVDIRSLQSHCRLEPAADGQGVRFVLKGRVEADIVQLCSISLEEVVEQAQEDFIIYFVDEKYATMAPATEIEIRPDEEDLEVMTSSIIDIGEQVAQQLALAINPYPRSASAKGDELGYKILQEDDPSLAEEKKNPFAILKGLKD